MTHNKKLLLGVVLLLMASLALGGIAGCCPAEEPTPTPTATAEASPTAAGNETPVAGEAPTLAEGDTWTYAVTYKGETSDFVLTAGAVGAEEYEVHATFPELLRIEAVTGMELETEWHGEMVQTYTVEDLDLVAMLTPVSAMGMDVDFGMTATYEHATAKWPLTVGAEWTGHIKKEVVGLLDEQADLTVVVEGIEDVTVAAGTFSCYKIVTSADGDVMLEEWFAEAVKAPVKRVDGTYWDEAETWELQSYTVAP